METTPSMNKNFLVGPNHLHHSQSVTSVHTAAAFFKNNVVYIFPLYYTPTTILFPPLLLVFPLSCPHPQLPFSSEGLQEVSNGYQSNKSYQFTVRLGAPLLEKLEEATQ